MPPDPPLYAANAKMHIFGGITNLLESCFVFPPKDVPFGGLVHTAPHFGGKIPQNPYFWGVNRHFQA